MADYLKRLEKAAKGIVLAREARDDLIFEASVEGGLPVTHIARAVGLERTQVHRIIKERTMARHPDPN